jgi:putative PLP-dependent aminotransferase (TIGR04422 family)
MLQWPKPKKFKFDKKQKKFSLKAVNKVENFFSKNYNYKYASLAPSARASINLILKFTKFDRSKVVNVPKWSSHCLFETIGAMSNITINDPEANCILIVHKWGKTSFYKKKKLKQILIEDSADSLPGDNFKAFENNSDYEIISLPKIIGTFSGGIILSNNKIFYEYCKKKQNEGFKLGKIQSNKKFKFLFNSKLNNNWFYDEALNTSFDSNVINNIEKCIPNFENNKKIIKKRQTILKSFFPNIEFDKKRIGPCAIFQKKYFKKFDKELETKHFDFSQKILKENFEKCLILPIHFGISDNKFKKKLENLLKLYRK